jgi:two-component system chemotaxis sensor kinase CheA
MKGARAFLIITNLERLSQILKSIPTLEDLKAGKFNFSFTVILITKERLEVIREELLNISEVDDADVEIIEILQARTTVAEQAAPSLKKIESIRIPVERLDKIMNLMGELTIAKTRLMQVIQTYRIDPLEEVAFMLDRLSSSLQDEIMQTRLLPVAYILDTFPRVVRDLARTRNKEVDLEITGGEIELDRVVLNEIGDPLVHLIRNAIDHGIESPQQRQALHKSPHGKLAIKVSRQKGQILIEVIDDGKGVDFSAVRRAALNKGLISQEEAQTMDNKKVLDLISLPGFSTAEKITEISGRGVGLDVVRSKMDTLGGRLDFETKPGEGSRFILTLPLTLAIIKAMLVKVVNEIFAIPLMSIRETIKLKEDEVKMLQNFEVIRVREEVIPIIRLEKELGIPPSEEPEKEKLNGRISVVIVEYGQKSIGLTVSQVLGEQDIVVKPLGSLMKRIKGIAGATILGDGRVALILDILSLR